MKTLQCCQLRQSILDGSEDFVVNLSALSDLSEASAREFLDATVLTSGMEDLIVQAFDRMSGGTSRGIFKLSESMGGGKTQSMIVTGILSKYPNLLNVLPFKKPLAPVTPDYVIAFTGRSTDQNVWTSIGSQLGAVFSEESAPSEKQWAEIFKGRTVLVLLDELAFYLVHAASRGSREEGARFSQRTAIALTNLFGAVRDHKDSARVVVIVADLQKDWEQGHEELSKIMTSNATLGGTIQSTNNEMSKGAVSISPVDNAKDELYAILRKRLFKKVEITDTEKLEVIDAYINELQTAKKAKLIERALPTIRAELSVSYPFHFSTKHLIETFNDNPGFQKTRDVIRLMASIVRSIWRKGEDEVSRHSLLSLASADLNLPDVASRFKEIKRSLEGAMQTDIANNGTSYAESLAKDSGGLSILAAKWIYVASLSDIQPRGISREEIAEYIAEPGVDLLALNTALTELSRTCWYLDNLRSGRFFFNKVQNLNAQINSYHKTCSDLDRDQEIEGKIREMFEPREKRCYQVLLIHPDFRDITLIRDKTTLIICQQDAPFQKLFDEEKYKNRIAFLTLVDSAGIFRIRNYAKRIWAIKQVLKDLSRDNALYERANQERGKTEAELFLAIRSIYARLIYPLADSTGVSITAETTLLDNFLDDSTGEYIKYDAGKDGKNIGKGEFVVETTLRSVQKFHVISPATGVDKVKDYKQIRTRVETFLFPSSGRAGWDQILDAAGSRGVMLWCEPNTLGQMKDVLLTAGEWREQAGQIVKPPFEEVTAVSIEHERNPKTGIITTTDIKLIHADKLYVSEDGAPEKKIKHDEAFESDSMVLLFQARDSTGKNKDGKPSRIENSITLSHAFLPSAKVDHVTVVIRAVPPSANVRWTSDGSDPANHGQEYPPKGIEVQRGVTIKVYAEKASCSIQNSIVIPMSEGEEDTFKINQELPATLLGPGLKKLELLTRNKVHDFLVKLPAGTLLVGTRAKVVKAATDNRVAITWDSKFQMDPSRHLEAYKFLDAELPDAEWELEATGGIIFPSGHALLNWQKECSITISPELITQ